MAIAQLPRRIPSATNEWTHGESPLQSSELWTRSLAVVSLIAGAILLAKGRSKGGLAAASMGAAAVLLEDPKRAGTLWRNIPSCIEAGKRLVSQAENFFAEMETQRARLLTLVERARHG